MGGRGHPNGPGTRPEQFEGTEAYGNNGSVMARRKDFGEYWEDETHT